MKHQLSKKIVAAILVIVGLSFLFYAQSTYGTTACEVGGPGAGIACSNSGDLGGKIGGGINSIRGVVAGVAYALCALFVVIGGVLYITSKGDPAKTEKGKKTILFALIGLAIVYAADTIAGMVGSDGTINFSGLQGPIEGSILSIYHLIVGIAAALCVLFIVIGGINYLTSKGDPAKTEKGKKTIIYALVGLLICGLAEAISGIVSGGGINAAGLKNDVQSVIIAVANAIIGIAAAVAVFFVVIGGINYLTSAGDPAKTEKGKKTIIYALIGLAICGLAYVIVNWFIGATGI